MAKRTVRKATRKTAKKTTKRTTKKAAAPAAKPVRLAKTDRARTKAEIYGIIADQVGISKKEVAGVFDTVHQVIAKDLSKGGPGAVNVGGLMKVTVQRKPATKARKGTNPFTGEEMMFKAKPARNVVKIRPLKSLKDSV